MANDRVYLRCRTCGEAYMLAKWYPGDGFTPKATGYDSLGDWIETHDDCVPIALELPPDGGFHTVSERNLVDLRESLDR